MLEGMAQVVCSSAVTNQMAMSLRKHAHAIYRKKNVVKIFSLEKFDFFLIFAQNIDCGYTLEPHRQAVLTSTHNLCFRAYVLEQK